MKQEYQFPEKLPWRIQIQVDVDPRLKQKLRQLAADRNTTLKVVVLEGLARAYPELEIFVRADLEPIYQDQPRNIRRS